MTVEERLADLYGELADVNTAIRKVLASQSYSLGSRSVTRADLAQLRAHRKDLQAQIDALEDHGTTRRRFRRVVPLG